MLFCVTLFLVYLLTQCYVPHYIIFHFIFSFYHGTAYLANPSEIPFLISHSRMIILYSMTALDITYLPKLQITWEKRVCVCLRMPWLHGDFILCFPFFLLFPNWLKKMHPSFTNILLLYVSLNCICSHTFLYYFFANLWIFISSSTFCSA